LFLRKKQALFDAIEKYLASSKIIITYSVIFCNTRQHLDTCWLTEQVVRSTMLKTQLLGDCFMPQGENWLTTGEIAKDLKVNVNTVRRWIQSGELVALDVGGEYRISREDYEEFVQRRKTDRRKQ
jgi:excisionase family DNA binding protein